MAPLPIVQDEVEETPACPEYDVERVMHVAHAAGLARLHEEDHGLRGLPAVVDDELTAHEFESTRAGLSRLRAEDPSETGYVARQAFLALSIMRLDKWDRAARVALAALAIREGMKRHGYRLKRWHGGVALVVTEPSKMFGLHGDWTSLTCFLGRVYEKVPISAPASRVRACARVRVSDASLNVEGQS